MFSGRATFGGHVAQTTASLAVVPTKLAAADQPLKLIGPKILRLHRDVRFGKDKTPIIPTYRTIHSRGPNPVAIGSGSRMARHAVGIPANPTAPTTLPPTIAQVVSTLRPAH
ncbi:MAG: hypothetical protein KBG15_13665 [Kofleriaceae bacterium]|nr:hypothetical protein [Kofleriaceae bacterium]